ncbi:Asp-tRNA(Asn)/Glu-tRNA(Gln) amidotransferase subunit GatC [Candidatus Saccharibacteria bacterium]|nr:Asp-tRNA(Asn)/Glu-tRNA(Gln) amidotransferase subunit GatC [Candidatus Saccharibacteria bacterium]
MTAITLNDVKQLAQMSALTITDEQAEALRRQLEDILSYVAQLDEVDTTGIEPTYQVGGLENVLRPDEIKDYHVSRDDLLKNAPETENGAIKVKKVL